MSPKTSTAPPERRTPAVALQAALDWIVGGSRARWLIAGVALCTLLPWFFSCPLFAANRESRQFWAEHSAGVVQRKINHPLYDYGREFPADSNEAKRNFRLVVPVLAKLSGLGLTGVHVVRFALQAVLILGLLLAAEQASGDRKAAIGIALAIAGTHVGTEVWRDIFYWFDNCAHAFVVLALLATGPWLAGTAVLLGLLVDERVVGAVPLLVLFNLVLHRPRSVATGLVLAVPVYAALRLGLTVGLGMTNPAGSIGVAPILIPNLANAPAAFWFSLEGGWLFLAIAARDAKPARTEIAALFVLTLLPLMAAGFVGDFTRSATYVFPATFVAVALLAGSGRTKVAPIQMRVLAGWAAGISLLVPNAIVLGESVAFESSLPVRALQAWLRQL